MRSGFLIAMFVALFVAIAGAPNVGAQTEAAPAVQLFVVRYAPGPAWIEGRPMAEQDLRPHGAYYRDLLERGHVFAAGGFAGEGGMAILQAPDMEAAQAIVAADPAIVSGVFVGDLQQWRPRFRTDAPLPDVR